MGLRIKLALLVAGVAAVVAAVLGLLVHEQTSRRQLDVARQALDAKLVAGARQHAMRMDGGVLVDPEDLPAALRRTVTDSPVRATYLERGADGPVLWAATVPAAPGAGGGGPDEPGGSGTVLAVRESYRPQAQALAALDRTLVGAGAAATALGSLLGALAAGVTGRRIGRSARTAQRIAGGDLSARVRPGRGRDEVARLGAAVNTMADALGERLAAERRITADIAHELRTPVAGLVTAAELLPPGRPTELVRERVTVLRRLVEDVIEVARLETDGVERAVFETCRTAALARRAVAAHAAALPRPGPAAPVEVVVRADAEVRTDPRRVARVLANLLANAERHGRPPVVLEVAGRELRVRDHGPGFPADLLAHGPRRFRTGAPERGHGTGLGLTIVTGQARLLGATVTWANVPGAGGGAEGGGVGGGIGGAVAVLRLPVRE
ncbi:sensor histidine kinase [Streptomyces aidingensis]|uniref:histidine kinase n=1 Tax=Streptomyces aidingensis TaxID=910347 RepID=A0A1I1HJY9_9ACTN|nr:HAMP domain-containing sensor histidine kinase [Streptomyces aidingensis]SFC24387.1 Signal transduction histidine kinase [Streptomyces aidingensis]